MHYFLRLIPFLLTFCLYAAQVHDSVMIDKLAKYVTISPSELHNLYNKASHITCGKRVNMSFNRPIFMFFPGLIDKLPHITLGSMPTPVNKLKKMGKVIGCKNLYIKRDDNTGKKVPGKNYLG